MDLLLIYVKHMWITWDFMDFIGLDPPVLCNLKWNGKKCRAGPRAPETSRNCETLWTCCPVSWRLPLAGWWMYFNQLTNLPPFIAAATPKNTPLLSQVWYLPPGACIGSPIFHGEVVCISSAQQSRRDEEVVALVLSCFVYWHPCSTRNKTSSHNFSKSSCNDCLNQKPWNNLKALSFWAYPTTVPHISHIQPLSSVVAVQALASASFSTRMLASAPSLLSPESST